MKAVLVIDMPKCCEECQLNNYEFYLCSGANESTVNCDEEMCEKRLDFCPLRPLPEPITEYEVKVSFDYDEDYAMGYNDFYRKITGETE